jgi:hypothetical protein
VMNRSSSVDGNSVVTTWSVIPNGLPTLEYRLARS